MITTDYVQLQQTYLNFVIKASQVIQESQEGWGILIKFLNELPLNPKEKRVVTELESTVQDAVQTYVETAPRERCEIDNIEKGFPPILSRLDSLLERAREIANRYWHCQVGKRYTQGQIEDMLLLPEKGFVK